MRNFVIINGVNSNTINGLGINELPPITKPEMRNIREEIDGRDGDITTNLGYSAYDKTITIGLFGTGYDINNIVAFFNGEGTIVFSNEPDKYYNFKILNQIDYESLQKFKTASITFHCQPFKYPLSETPLEIEYDYIEQEGETLTLNNTGNSTLKLDLKGNTSQSGTPTPTSPIPVSVVSGDNEVVVCGKNLAPFTNQDFTLKGIHYFAENGSLYVNGTSSGETYSNSAEFKNNFAFTLPAGTYTFSWKFANGFGAYFKKYSDDTNLLQLSSAVLYGSITLNEETKVYIGFYVYQANANNENLELMVEMGSKTSYEPYQSQTYEVDLPVENILKYPFEQTTKTDSGITFTDNGDGSITVNGTATANVLLYLTDNSYSNDYFRKAVLNKQITISGCPSGGSSTTYRIQLWGAGGGTIYDTGSGATTTFTNTSTSYNLVIGIQSGTTCNNLVFKPMVEYGNKVNTYQPYGTTPIELCKIGDYQDYFTKNSDGEWCKYNAIGKYTFTGNETLTLQNNGKRIFINSLNNSIPEPLHTPNISTTYGMYCNKLVEVTAGNTWNGIQGISYDYSSGSNLGNLDISINGISTLEDYRTAIAGIVVYYILATPYLSLIEDNNLIEQLDAIQNAVSYTGQTNISQVNNDKAFIISAKALEKGTNEVVVNNIGNVYSKPLIALDGSGNVDIYLDNTQILKANVESKMNIDIAQLEAYNPDTSALLNRQVIGNYNSMTLQPGNNTIRIDGSLDKATITNYTRWL